MSNYLHRKVNGFTIVELIIVIVVIAILAAITLVAYNGITVRAANTTAGAGDRQYYEAMLNYHTLNDAYPDTSGCLGANYPNNQCWTGQDGTFSTNATLTSELSSVMNTQPTLATSLFFIGVNNDYRAGAIYFTGSPSYIVYYFNGINQSCFLPNSTSYNEGGLVTQCRVNLP